MYIGKELAIKIHDDLIMEFGGEAGLRDINILLDCLIEPATHYYGQEQYPSLEEKAAVYLFQVVTRHPFIDGNKRLGFVLAKYFLIENGYDLKIENEEIVKFVLEIAKGNKTYEQVLEWIIENLNERKINKGKKQ